MYLFRIFLLLIVVSLLMITFSCEKGADPTVFNEPFRGITYTNAEGDIIGPVDENDWQLFGNFGDFKPDPTEYSFIGYTPKVDPAPANFGIAPAYPNPSNDTFFIPCEFPIDVKFSFLVMNDNNQVAFNIEGKSEYGWVTIPIPICEFKIPFGIYRVEYSFCPVSFYYKHWGGIYGHGDIWYTNEVKDSY